MTTQSQTKFAIIVATTRKKTNTMVKFWKHMGQILWERIPVLSPGQELLSGKGFISEVKIIPYSTSRWGRVIIVITESIFAYILVVYGSHILRETKRNLYLLIFEFHIPAHISIQTATLMVVMSIGTIGYYGMIKPGDFKQAIKEHEEEENERN